jgi:hypothetical protein
MIEAPPYPNVVAFVYTIKNALEVVAFTSGMNQNPAAPSVTPAVKGLANPATPPHAVIVFKPTKSEIVSLPRWPSVRVN